MKFVPKISMHEYFIDFLGGLVPGILFLVGNSFILFPSVYAFYCSLSNIQSVKSFIPFIKDFLVATKDTPSAIWLISFIVLFFLAYTIGHLFYRHDPNEPDKKSFLRLAKKNKYENDEKLKEELASDMNPSNYQFPYTYYDEYLKKRKLDYLLPFVLWKGERSKAFINLLKTRLMYYRMDKCGTIIRNEAHVRMASSTWYVSRFLALFGLFGFLLSLLSLIISVNVTKQFETFSQGLSWYLVFLILPLLVSLFSYYFYTTILNFLHYQRLREVFIVLDTYCTAFQENPDLMKTPVDDFMCDTVKEYNKYNETSNKVFENKTNPGKRRLYVRRKK